MALFTDANIVTLDDLLRYETTLVQIASSHGLNVNTKIALATSAIADTLMQWLLDVGMSDPQWQSRRLLGLSTVVVTPPLLRWLQFESLSRFFVEAHNIQLNSRFQSQASEYQRESAATANLAMQAGIGIVFKPLPEPALPSLTPQAGLLPAQGMFVQTAWVDESGNESAPSPINGVVLMANSSITVDMATPPPPAASGWNVYANLTSVGLTRQNLSPVAIASSWSLPGAGLVAGVDPSGGQRSDFYIMLSRQIRRG
jgi:hypothetical protein